MRSTLIAAVSAALPLASATINVSDFTADKIIYKDVAIIGGGAAGAHAAVRLRERFGKSVVVIEKDTLLVSGLCQ